MCINVIIIICCRLSQCGNKRMNSVSRFQYKKQKQNRKYLNVIRLGANCNYQLMVDNEFY